MTDFIAAAPPQSEEPPFQVRLVFAGGDAPPVPADWVPGLQSDGATYYFLQPIAAQEWDISHELGAYPGITVQVSAGLEMLGTVDHLTANTLKVTFSEPVEGYALLVVESDLSDREVLPPYGPASPLGPAV